MILRVIIIIGAIGVLYLMMSFGWRMLRTVWNMKGNDKSDCVSRQDDGSIEQTQKLGKK